MTVEPSYVAAGTRPWSKRAFDEVISGYPGEWYFISRPEELTLEYLSQLAPRFIFFLHWSWKVPPEITDTHECVAFHMTDVPYGRGGSPLQNLILRGHKTTKLTALRMVEELDAGPVYLKETLSLEGNAQEIYARSAHMAAKMVRTIIESPIEPIPQSGEPVIFQRRNPVESQVPKLATSEAIYDFIRMLDAEGYPRAFVEHGSLRYEFSSARRYHGSVRAEVKITPLTGNIG